MKSKFVFMILAVAFCVLAVGCVQRVADFTIVSTKNVDITTKYVKKGTAEGEDMTFVLLIPFGNPNLKNAVDNCLEKGGGELLTNAVVNYTFTVYIGPLGYKVKGDVWNRASQSDLLNPSVEKYQLSAGAKGMELVSCANPAEKYLVCSTN